MPHRLFIVALALALAGCAAPDLQAPTATPAPTATVAPSATPTAAPTATPLPSATPSPAPAGGATAADTIAAAVQRTGTAGSYRSTVTLRGSGLLGSAATGPAELLTIDGSFAGDEYEYTLAGFLAAFLGAGESGLQIIRADGTTYVRGPLPQLAAPAAAWYRLPPAQGAQLAPPITASSTLPPGTDLSGFVAGEAGQRDGMACQSYVGDRAATLALAASVGQSAGGAFSPDDIDQAQTQLWVCQDGYIHAVAVSFSGTTATATGSAAQPFSVELTVLAFDFGAPITITAPADAQELATPVPAP